MNGTIEILIVGGLIVSAVAYLLRKGYRRISGRKSCGDCSCGSKSDAPSGSKSVFLTLHGRDLPRSNRR